MNRYIMKFIILATSIIFSGITFSQERIKIEDYVKQTFIRGIPYEEARQYDKSNIAILKKMLKDKQQSDYWANIVVMLEIIGDDNVVDDIVAFIEMSPDGEYSASHYRAKIAAIYGLGYLINHLDSKKAERYLVDSLSPEVWETRGVKGRSSKHRFKEDQDNEMSKYAVLGLALSGSESGAEELKRFKNSKVKHRRFRSQVDGMIDTLLSENEKVRKHGFRTYYKDKH